MIADNRKIREHGRKDSVLTVIDEKLSDLQERAKKPGCEIREKQNLTAAIRKLEAAKIRVQNRKFLTR